MEVLPVPLWLRQPFLLAKLDFVDFVCIKDECLKGEIEQPSQQIAAYEHYPSDKVVLVEIVRNDQRGERRY